MTYIIFVIDAAKLSSIKETQTEDAIRKWVKYACDREGGRKRRCWPTGGSTGMPHATVNIDHKY